MIRIDNGREVDICVVGAVGVDTNCYLYTDDVDYINESNYTSNIDGVGQAGGYSSRLSAALGYSTYFFGYVGRDWQGEFIRNTLNSEGIHTHFFIDTLGTKRSINLVTPDGRRKNFYDGKGAMQIKVNEADFIPVFRRSKIVHMCIVNWTRELLDAAATAGCVVSTDLQDMPSTDDEYRRDFLSKSDIVFFSGVNLKEPLKSLEELMNRYPEKLFVCGMGKGGAAFGYDGRIETQAALEIDREIVDSNGAGDSLAIGTLCSLIEGYTLKESVFRGQLVARYTCTLKAHSKDFLNREGLEKYFNEKRDEMI
ncbi:MAG TPA: carbohydrate kinase family protein [Thermotogota bacterium]|nr:carbohydrate kinase family protein [Thermotogota bacterium]HPJ88268.1 carbohydrate kinase family protein [Thermotogota bacterium]HPR96744.1 carbohydrate kinase family protein [Thermotogota bacterium]